MIHWLVESAQNIAEPPEAFLNAAELEKLASFRFEKRRADWLLGRWTAKRLLQAVWLLRTTELVARDALEIANDKDGVPHATLHGQPLDWHISISHSNNYALCAASQGIVGADLEVIETREEALVRDYFTLAEQANVNIFSPAQRALIVTAIWSAKEATLKALGKGLSVDTRAVEISLASFRDSPTQWTSFDVKLNLSDPNPLYGWWRTEHGFTITMTTPSPDMPDETPLTPEAILIPEGDLHEGHGVLPHRIAQATRHHARHTPGD